MSAYGQIAIVDVSPDKEFSTNVAKLLNLEPHNTQVDKFKDSETNIRIEQSVRGKDVYIFQSYIPPIGERLYELHNAVSATQSGGEASRVTAVMPYCFGMRGERATGARQSTQAVVVARQLYAMGVDKVITVGLHSEAVQSIFLAVGEKEGIKVEHLEFEPLAASYIIKTAQERNYRNIVIASPDVGGTKRVRKTRSIVVKNSNLDARIAIGDKYRQKQDEAEILEIIGDVRGKQVFLYDDIGDTLGTISGAVQAIKERGAQGIYLMFIHPVLGQGYERNLKQLCDDRFVKEIVFSDTIPLKEIALKCDKVRTIAIEPFIAEAIKRINADKSMSELHKYNEIMGIYEKCPIHFNGRTVPMNGKKLEELVRK